MKKHCRKTPLRALVSGLFGILIFLIVLVVFRFIAQHTSWPLFHGFVDLLFANAQLIIFLSVLFMIGEIFATFSFPLNLPFPIFNAAGSVLLVSFLISLLKYIDTYYTLGSAHALDVVKIFLLPLTLIIVLIAGYLSIFLKWKGPDPTSASPGTGPSEDPAGSPSWETIGDEFRQMIADLLSRVLSMRMV